MSVRSRFPVKMITGPLFILVVLLACFAATLMGCGAETPSGSGASGSDAGPAEFLDFTLPDLAGRPVRLADYRVKIVIIDFWATWCPPCIFQVPELNAFWEAHQAAGEVMVIGVAVDVEGAEVVGPWAEENGVSYSLVIGDENVAREFGAMGFPTLVIVRPDGSLDSRHVGLVEAEELEELVAAARGIGAT
jgi:thiol-disulfide isomerase/thioredoxin